LGVLAYYIKIRYLLQEKHLSEVNAITFMDNFYFKKYDEIIGTASNKEEFIKEITRLSKTEPECVNYHLREGHVSQWLDYMGYSDTSEKIKNVKDANTAFIVLKEDKSPNEMLKRENASRGRSNRSNTKKQ
jgi:hypothetical protein